MYTQYSNPEYVYEAARKIGLLPRVIAAHWIAETGWQFPAHNNPANIMTSGGTPLEYPDPETGILAYASLLLTSQNYVIVRQARHVTWMPTDEAEILALGFSPWDVSHYVASGGVGTLLYNVFRDLAASNILPTVPKDPTTNINTHPEGVPVSETKSESQTLIPPSAPKPGSDYIVRSGDSLWRIAYLAYGNGARFGEIARANGLSYPFSIHPGDTLKIPV